MKKLIGPFKQLLTMRHLPLKGALKDEYLERIEDGGILVDNGKIEAVGKFTVLAKFEDIEFEELKGNFVGLPGFVDPHTHICWEGSREKDYALTLAGKSYLEIAEAGGGIWDTVTQTRKASSHELMQTTVNRANHLLAQGVTTIEVKSGYGLSVEAELKILEAIQNANQKVTADIITTCLAAHICPNDFHGTSVAYLDLIVSDLLPKIKARGLSKRVDIFIEEAAFKTDESLIYLQRAKELGFDIAVHADQFTTGGSQVAVKVGALSVDHLEASSQKEIEMLAKSNTICVALPGASLGLGAPFTPARKLLDAGAGLAIGSDWNPGSAPMGDVLVQAAILGMYEKLTNAEIFAGITFRAARALGLNDRGILSEGKIADIAAFEMNDFREILYKQGSVKPSLIYKNGTRVP